jgi:hypothetical protein
MSASSTPTWRPLAASAAARFTVTELLPTPPLPEATQITRVVAGTAVAGARSRTFQRARAMAWDRCCWSISVQASSTAVTPGRSATRVRTSRWIWARRGQPAVVRAMVTVTVPSGATSADRAMPRSTMSLPSSGSITPRRTFRTSSALGSCVPRGSGPELDVGASATEE